VVWRFIPIELGGGWPSWHGWEEEGDGDVALGGWLSRH